jgi:hypothetical protein
MVGLAEFSKEIVQPVQAAPCSQTIGSSLTIESTPERFLFVLVANIIEFHSLWHPLPVEQGGVWHRSARPQQVVPGALALSLNRLGADISLSRFWLPQLVQANVLLSEELGNKNSDTFPHS